MSASSTTWARASPPPSRRWRRCCARPRKRGLIYVDDGSSPRSLAGQIAGANNLAFAKADLVHRRGADAGRDRPRARRGSKRIARERGIAVGFASALPVSIDRIARMGQGRRRPRHPAGADHRGGAQAEVELSRRANREWRAAHSSRLSLHSPFAIRGTCRCDMPMPRYESLPYRPCVGIMVLNRAGPASSSAARTAGPSTSTPRMSGRCRRAASTRARTPTRRRCASSYEETNIRSVEKLGEIAEWLTYDIPREIVGEAWKGKLPRPDAEMVRAALHRRGQRDRHRQPGRRRTSRNSSTGAGSRWTSCRRWSSRSSARSTSGW